MSKFAPSNMAKEDKEMIRRSLLEFLALLVALYILISGVVFFAYLSGNPQVMGGEALHNFCWPWIKLAQLFL